MDVLTISITLICPNYAEHVWNKVMKDIFPVKEERENVDLPKLTLQRLNIYLKV